MKNPKYYVQHLIVFCKMHDILEVGFLSKKSIFLFFFLYFVVLVIILGQDGGSQQNTF